jgi:N4-gp56 family major capsid protein
MFPPGNQVGSNGLTHLATVYYERLGLNKLLPKLQFQQVFEPSPLPKGSGRTKQFYRMTVGTTANTVPQTDGITTVPVSMGSNTVSGTVEEYSDWTSASKLLEDTDISPTAENMVAFMSERGAFTADTLARIEADSAVSTVGVSTVGAYLSAADFKQNTAKMEGLNIGPHTGTDFLSPIHPYAVYDIVSDNTAGGFIDCMKYQQGTALLNGEVGKIGNCRLLKTTNVGTTGTAPNVFYYTYIFGFQPGGCVDLAGNGPNKVMDLANERFNTLVSKSGVGPWDPVGTNGTYVGYRFVTVFKLFYTANEAQYRFRIVKCDAQVV